MMSVEEARRAPVQRLSDRLSFGDAGMGMGDFGSDVDDTMMDILANRGNNASFGENNSFALGMDEYLPPKTLLPHTDHENFVGVVAVEEFLGRY